MKTRSMTRAENAELLSALYTKTQNWSANPTLATERATCSTQPNTRYRLRTRRSTIDYAEPDFVYADDKKDTDYAPFVFQRPAVSFAEPEITPIRPDPIHLQIIEPSDEIIQSFYMALRSGSPRTSTTPYYWC
jgi:hypothetical protein